jgi:hypothetical protein
MIAVEGAGIHKLPGSVVITQSTMHALRCFVHVPCLYDEGNYIYIYIYNTYIYHAGRCLASEAALGEEKIAFQRLASVSG